MECGFSADNKNEENSFETVPDLLEDSDFEIKKQNDLNNDIILIYAHKML